MNWAACKPAAGKPLDETELVIASAPDPGEPLDVVIVVDGVVDAATVVPFEPPADPG